MRERLRLQRSAVPASSSQSFADEERKRPFGLQAVAEPAQFSDAAQSLPDTVRSPLEARFDHDFSHVRVFAGHDAEEATTALGASAYTIGNDIVVRPGEYNPDTPTGRTLIAHELSHVVQQRGGSAGRHELHQSGDNFEQEASDAAWSVMSGYAAPHLSQLGPGAHIQRWSIPIGVYGPPQKADPIAESERAQRDYTDALDYINDFYGNVNRCLDFAHGAESTAIGIFTRTTSTPDPPDMTKEAIMSILNLGFTAVGGWDVVEKGLTKGLFATNLWRLQRGLGEKIGTHAVEALSRLGPSDRDAALAKQILDLTKEGVAAGRAGAGAVGADEDTEGGRSAGAANKAATKSLFDWGQASAVALQEKEIAKANLNKIRDDPQYRSRLLEETKSALGTKPDPIGMGQKVLEVEKKYELELYKKRFGPGSGVHIQEIRGMAGVYSRTLHGGGDSMGRVVARIAELLGWPKAEGHQNDLRVAAWLGVPTVVQRTHESGRML